MKLIIVAGLPATGKTTLAKTLAKELSLPLITKDEIKELLFDTLGFSNREWSKKIGAASIKLMNNFIVNELTAGKSVIVESNFKPEFDNHHFQTWQKKFDFAAIQIICETDGPILYERFKQRALSGNRHPGHADATNDDEFKDSLLREEYEPLSLKGEVIHINTTDFSTINYENIFKLLH